MEHRKKYNKLNKYENKGNNKNRKIRRRGMSLIGIVAKKKDIQLIKKEIAPNKIEIIEITEESIENLKNIKFEEIINTIYKIRDIIN